MWTIETKIYVANDLSMSLITPLMKKQTSLSLWRANTFDKTETNLDSDQNIKIENDLFKDFANLFANTPLSSFACKTSGFLIILAGWCVPLPNAAPMIDCHAKFYLHSFGPYNNPLSHVEL